MEYLFLEAEEVKKAVKNKDMDNLEEELGDYSASVCIPCVQIAKENKSFNIIGVIRKTEQKNCPEVSRTYLANMRLYGEKSKRKKKLFLKKM